MAPHFKGSRACIRVKVIFHGTYVFLISHLSWWFTPLERQRDPRSQHHNQHPPRHSLLFTHSMWSLHLGSLWKVCPTYHLDNTHCSTWVLVDDFSTPSLHGYEGVLWIRPTWCNIKVRELQVSYLTWYSQLMYGRLLPDIIAFLPNLISSHFQKLFDLLP